MSLWQSIKSALRAPRVQVGGGAIVPVAPLYTQYQRIGGNLLPSDVSSILNQADTGDISRLVCLAHESRQKDGTLHSVLSTRENSLSNLGVTVSAFKERGQRDPKKRDSKIAAFVQDAIEGAAGNGQELRSFADLVPHLQGAVYHGHATAETAWRKDGSTVLPDGFRCHDQRRFKFRPTDGRLVWSDLWGSAYTGVDLQATYPGQFLQHMPRINGDVAAREGLSRLLVWAAVFRNWGTADWLKLAELSWKPWRLGRLKKGNGSEDRRALIEILQSLTSNGIAVLTENQEIDIRWPGSSGGAAGSTSTQNGSHQALCEFMAAEMAKAVLGQTLTTDQGKIGSQALGKVHNEIRKDIRDNDAVAVAATIRRDLVRPLVQMNFGDVPIPHVSFNTDDAPDLLQFAQAIKTLRDPAVDMQIPSAWAHDMTGIPEADGDESVLGIDVDLTELEPPNGAPNEPPADPDAQDQQDNAA